MNITIKHKDYINMQTRWEMCRAAAEGEHAVHEKGEMFLPRLENESARAYQTRLKMTPFFNGVWRTISGLKGMIFRKRPIIEVPTALDNLLEDIDLGGTFFDTLLQRVTEESLTVGRVGLLVDYPFVKEGMTLADAASSSTHSYVKLYKAESIYNWSVEKIEGRVNLARVYLEESIEIRDKKDEFKVEEDKRYRILDIFGGVYRQRLFKIDGDKAVLLDEVFPKMNGKFMSFIPFLVIGTDDIGMDVDAPPLIDLVTTNFHHYLQATSYERGCFFSGLPTMFISGVDSLDQEGNPVEISIGGAFANILPRPEAKAYFVEVASEFNALRTNLEDKKREMAVLGARMLEQQKSSVESADTISKRQFGEESTLAAISITISNGMTRVLRWLADWENVTGDIKINLNTDFMPSKMSYQDMTALVSAWQSGAFSTEILFSNLQSGEIIPVEVSFEEEQERIKSASPLFAPQI